MTVNLHLTGTVATNEIASFCIDNGLCQKAFSCLSKWPKAPRRLAFELCNLF